MQTKQFHVIPNTLFPCLPTPAPTSRPLHHQPSASRYNKTRQTNIFVNFSTGVDNNQRKRKKRREINKRKKTTMFGNTELPHPATGINRYQILYSGIQFLETIGRKRAVALVNTIVIQIIKVVGLWGWISWSWWSWNLNDWICIVVHHSIYHVYVKGWRTKWILRLHVVLPLHCWLCCTLLCCLKWWERGE